MQNDANVFVYNGGPIPENIDKENITHVQVNEGVTSIPDYAFNEGWSSLTSVFIADGVTSIGDQAFYECQNLISIHLPVSLETIGKHAFSGCTKLVRIRLPPNITVMGQCSFLKCFSLSIIEIPSSMDSTASYTFSLCKALSKVTIPTSVSSIDVCSFSNCHSMISIKLHSAIRFIDYDAFGSCTSLLSIQVPPSTKVIEDEAFASCTSLMIAYFPSTAIDEYSLDIFGREKYCANSHPHNPNLILLTDRDDFVYHDNHRGDTPTLTLHTIQQCIHNIPNNNNTHASIDNNDDDDLTNGNNTSTTTTVTTTTTTLQQQLQALHQVLHDQCPDIAQRAHHSGLNLLHLLVYFPGDILQPLTMLLDKCPLVTTVVDSTGRTPFHHTITSTKQNMDCACYDLLASRTPDKVVPLAIRSGAPWHEVNDIVKAKMNGLGIADEESGLMPFMMVAVVEEDEAEDDDDEEDEAEDDDDEEDEAKDDESDKTLGLTAVYELLCMKPDVMNEYVDVRRSACGTVDMETYVGYDGAGIVKRRRLK